MTHHLKQQTIKEWMHFSSKVLLKSGIESARLDILIMLEDCIHQDRSYILAHGDSFLSDSELKVLNKMIQRRSKHEPLAYIRRKSAFYGHQFYIDKSVLQPRPETETMVDLLRILLDTNQTDLIITNLQDIISSILALHLDKYTTSKEPINIADVGCGSGAIGISVQLLFPEVSVDLLDNDREALKVAKRNVLNFKLHNRILFSDLLTNTDRSYTILLVNLPYVPDNYKVCEATKFEPKAALYGGDDGLVLYRKLFSQLDKLKVCPQYILTESLLDQHSELEAIARLQNYLCLTTNGLIQVFYSKH